jgi:hypothetical protein
VVAARRTRRETVQYVANVANVAKYYIAYDRAEELRRRK